jgi:O-antigen/teichoic acid export membrane protein
MIDPFIAAARRVRIWGPLLTGFTILQIIFQLVSAAAGLIFVRVLTKDDYAILTISGVWLGAFVNLSNCGVSSAAIAFGGRIWEDREALARVVSSALAMRKRLIALTLLPLSVAFVWNLRLGGASYVAAFIVASFVVSAAVFQISSGILIVVPRLRGEIQRLQLIDGINAAIRLTLALAAAVIYLDLYVAMAISTCGSFFQFFMVRRTAAASIDLHAPPDSEIMAKIRKLINRQWLNELNGVLQGQIAVVVLSLFGTVAAVADFGALGRVVVIFAALGATLQTVILPRYARCQDAKRLAGLYTQIMLSYMTIALGPFFVTLLFPEPFLWLLGPKYEGLGPELALAMLGTGLGVLNAFSWTLNTTRAWIIPGAVLVPASLLVQAILIYAIGVSTLRQVLFLGIFSNAIFFAINVGATLVFSRNFSRL